MTRRRAATTLAIAGVLVGVSGCVFLTPPPAPTGAPTVPSRLSPSATAEALPTVSYGANPASAAPLPSGFVAPPSPSPSASPAPTSYPPTDALRPEELGERLDGAPGITLTGTLMDTPTESVINPSRGQVQQWADGRNPFGSHADGARFMEHRDIGSSDHLLQSTVGRLYADAGDGYVATCSATVINSESGALILTAAHCLWDVERGEWFGEPYFVPGDTYEGAGAPWGTWAVEQVVVPGEFRERAEVNEDGRPIGTGWGFDFGFARLAPNANGDVIESVVGGQGISFAQRYHGVLTIGYPGAEPFDGFTPRFCSSTEVSFGKAEAQFPFYACNMTQGSSGSGWLTAVDAASGGGYVTAVTSGVTARTDDSPVSITGALLGERAQAIMEQIDGE